MLPGSVRRPDDKKLVATREAGGIYVVHGTYDGEYDFFAPSPIVPVPSKITIPASETAVETPVSPGEDTPDR